MEINSLNDYSLLSQTLIKDNDYIKITNKAEFIIYNNILLNNYLQQTDFNFITADTNLQSATIRIDENSLNERRLNLLEKNFTKQFISYIQEDDFEYGVESKASSLVKEQMKINSTAVKDWLNRIYINNFANSTILIGLLRIIARFERKELFPIGETMAIAALSHRDEIVQESGIRAFEAWGGRSSLKILKSIDTNSSWVGEYLKEVISDLEIEYADSKN